MCEVEAAPKRFIKTFKVRSDVSPAAFRSLLFPIFSDKPAHLPMRKPARGCVNARAISAYLSCDREQPNPMLQKKTNLEERDPLAMSEIARGPKNLKQRNERGRKRWFSELRLEDQCVLVPLRAVRQYPAVRGRRHVCPYPNRGHGNALLRVVRTMCRSTESGGVPTGPLSGWEARVPLNEPR